MVTENNTQEETQEDIILPVPKVWAGETLATTGLTAGDDEPSFPLVAPVARNTPESDNFLVAGAQGAMSGVGQGSAWWIDTPLNAVIASIEALGVDALDDQNYYNILDRFINPSDYESMGFDPGEKGGFGMYGTGERVGFHSKAGRIGEITGEFAALGGAGGMLAKLVGKIATKGRGALTSAEEAWMYLQESSMRNYKAITKSSKVAANEARLAGATEAEITAARLAGKFNTPTIGQTVKQIGQEQYVAPALNNFKNLMTREITWGGVGGAAYQSGEEFLGEGSGIYTSFFPLAIPVIGGAAKVGVGSVWSWLKNFSPTGKAITWVSEKEGVSNLAKSTSNIINDAAADVGATVNNPGRNARDQEALDATRKMISKEYNDPVNAAAVEDTLKAQERIQEVTGSELKLSPAESSMSPNLAINQERIERNAVGEQATQNVKRKIENISQVSEFGEQIFQGEVNSAAKKMLNNGNSVPSMSQEEIVRQTINLEDIAKRELAGEITTAEANLERRLVVADTSPDMIIDTASGKIEAILKPRKDSVSETESEMIAASDKVKGLIPELETETITIGGRSIRQQLEKQQRTAYTQADTLSVELGLNKKEAIGLVQPMRDAWLSNEAVAPLIGGMSEDSFHPLISKFLNKAMPTNDKGEQIMNFADWTMFRRQVGAAQESASAGGDQANALMLGELKSTLDTAMNFKGDLAANYKTWADWYYPNVVRLFEHNSVQRVINGSRATREGTTIKAEDFDYVMPTEQVALSFLENSNTARVFMERMGDSPEALRIMRGTVFDDVRRAPGVVKNGMLDPNGLERYLSRNVERGQALETIMVPHPVTGENISMGTLLRERNTTYKSLVESQGRNNEKVSEIEGSRLYKLIQDNWVNPSAPTPEIVIEQAMKNPSLMKELMMSVDNPLQKVALRKMIFGKALDAGISPEGIKSSTSYKPQDFGRFLAKNERVLEQALGQNHLDDIVILSDAMERILLTGLPKGGGIERSTLIDVFSSITGVTPQGYSARIINMMEGRVSPRTTAVWLASQAFRSGQTRAMDRAFAEAMVNPEFAKMLSGKIGIQGQTIKPTVNQFNNIRRAFFEAGIIMPDSEGLERQYNIPLNESNLSLPLPYSSGVPNNIPPQLPNNQLITPTPQPQGSSNPAPTGITGTSTPIPQGQPSGIPDAGLFAQAFPNDKLGIETLLG